MKNTTKTILCLMMALLLAFGLAACTQSEEPAEEPQETPAEETFSADDMIGVWADNVAGRATIEIQPAEEEGRYAILISWGNSAFETYLWSMTAEPTADNELYYNDCTHTIVTFAEDGTEENTEEVYTGGHGQLVLLSTNEIMWTDDIENAAENMLFVNVQ